MLLGDLHLLVSFSLLLLLLRGCNLKCLVCLILLPFVAFVGLLIVLTKPPFLHK